MDNVILGDLPEKWALYLSDCDASNTTPSFQDYAVWFDEQRLPQLGELHESAL